MCTVRKRNHFHIVCQNWAAQTGYSLPRQDRELRTGVKTFSLCHHHPMELFVNLLTECLFSSSFRLLGVFGLEIHWKKHGGLLLPLQLMLQGRRVMQIILEQEMWHGGRENHKHFCRNVAWKDFNNSCFLLCPKNFKGNKTYSFGLQKRVTLAKHNHKQLWY